MSEKSLLLKRRNFLAAIPAVGAAAWCGPATVSTAFAQSEPEMAATDKPLVDSQPILQTPGERSISYSWAVTAPATGWVEYGTSPELGQKTGSPIFGLLPYDNRFLSGRIENLEPNTKYYYRAITAPIAFKNAYDIKQGEPILGEIRSFTTAGGQPENASFAIINDTHQNGETLLALTKRLREIDADYTIWNGDLLNDLYTDDQVVQYIARPGGLENGFAAEKPLLFNAGNHDTRGPWARNLPKVLVPWEHNDPIDRPLGRNFAIRKGPIAFIGLDTGEDKPDAHPVFGGLAAFEPYRLAQQEWLKRILKRPEIASAPFIVAFCHIPLFDSNTRANGGDTLEGYAMYSKLGGQLWGPILHDAGVQLVIAAHTHLHRYDEPGKERTWAQLVGSGPQLDRAMIIHAKTENGKLQVTAEYVKSGEKPGQWTYEPRKNSISR